ncbi:hypothetical protein BH24ACT5_BH24ACT5_28800 [soil metagenome]
MRGAAGVVWHDERSFMAMPRSHRARLVRSQVERGRGAVPTVRRWMGTLDRSSLIEQADGHRFVWWPSLVDQHPEEVLADHVRDGQPSSRHTEVSADVWRRCRSLLPQVENLAGTFSESNRANCFGTTLAAAGHCDAGEQVLRDRFEGFLASSCTPDSGDDRSPGTVLVWRDSDGRVCHSAVTIGRGWAFEKPSQTWWTPRVVLDTRHLIRVNSTSGLRLERHRMKDVLAESIRRRGIRGSEVRFRTTLVNMRPPVADSVQSCRDSPESPNPDRVGSG